MTKFQLFSEFNDISIWGESLPDALLRQKELRPKAQVIKGETICREPHKIVKVLGMRNTSDSTRGMWKYVSAVCETAEGKILEIDAREVEKIS